MSHGLTRRRFFLEAGAGFTGIALAAMLDADGFFAKPSIAADLSSTGHYLHPLARQVPPQIPSAKACIFLYMNGGPSQMDLYDYKPELQKHDGKQVSIYIRPKEVGQSAAPPSSLLGSRRKWTQHARTGIWHSDALPLIATHLDKMAIVKSLTADSFAHGAANLQMNSGRIVQGHPSLGAWVAYGLGTTNQNLPAFIVMLDPRGGPISGCANWGSGYMPGAFEGTVLRPVGEPLLDLGTPKDVPAEAERNEVALINTLNAQHMASRPGYLELPSRLASYELAFKLQTAAPDAFDVEREDQTTREMYGLYDPKPSHSFSLGPATFGRQCLMARRLVERGVRFIQIYSGGGHQQQNWDAHYGMEENLAIHCPEVDKPISALLADLEQRGLLDTTLVVWGGEFGRQPVAQGTGRNHNPQGFTYWLAGGGVKRGVSYGETDEIGHEAVQNKHHIRDLHATILQLMGLDPQRLSYFYGGLNNRLTGVMPANVIKGIIA